MRFASHGGLTCAALGESIRNCNGVTHTHGGLTPAALVDMRLCIAKIAILPAHGRRNSARSGGRKPPVGKLSLSSARIALLQRRPYMQPRAGGVSPPWRALRLWTRNAEIHRIAPADAVCKPRRADVRGVGRKHSQLQRRYSHPRRADARRSCGYAFVHRKNRRYSGRRPL
jgi:hypothetical protein